jgi:opacity protein-like surface antigen
MIAKFVSVTATGSALTRLVLTSLLLTILLGAQGQGFAQTTPAGQTPAAQPAEQTPAAQPPAAPASTAQQPESGQEPATEESPARRQARPHDYKNWNFSASAGANMNSGATYEFVRGGGGAATAGVARNANKYLGLRADFIWANLPLRQSVLGLAQATGATNNVYSITLDPIVNIPVTKLYGGYVLFGPGFYHRVGHLENDTTVPGTGCNSFWSWWGACLNSNVSIPLSSSFVDSTLNEFGYNFGGGVARKMPSGVEIYAEYRFVHGSRYGVTTDFRPITVGFRW